MFQVAGMHCQGCVNTVSAALRNLGDVDAVDIELAAAGASTVHVRATRALTVDEVQAALREEGEFSVLPA